jgi:hypothetical protein
MEKEAMKLTDALDERGGYTAREPVREP